MRSSEEWTERKWGIKEWTFVIALMLNFGSFVWGAATMSSSIRQVKESFEEFKVVVNTRDMKDDAQTDRFEARLRLAEVEIAVIKAQIYLIEQPKRK